MAAGIWHGRFATVGICILVAGLTMVAGDASAIGTFRLKDAWSRPDSATAQSGATRPLTAQKRLVRDVTVPRNR